MQSRASVGSSLRVTSFIVNIKTIDYSPFKAQTRPESGFDLFICRWESECVYFPKCWTAHQKMENIYEQEPRSSQIKRDCKNRSISATEVTSEKTEKTFTAQSLKTRPSVRPQTSASHGVIEVYLRASCSHSAHHFKIKINTVKLSCAQLMKILCELLHSIIYLIVKRLCNGQKA